MTTKTPRVDKLGRAYPGSRLQIQIYGVEGEKYRSYLFTCKMELRVMPVPTESFKITLAFFKLSRFLFTG